jgi:hypothetical protein
MRIREKEGRMEIRGGNAFKKRCKTRKYNKEKIRNIK